MEHFCKELLPGICVDYNNEEVQDIINAVDIFIKRLVKEIEKTNPDIKIEDVVLCGSNAEKTRVWGTSDIEFDYLAIMKTWPGIKNFRFEHCADRQMNVEYIVNVEDNTFASSQYISLYPGVTDAFRKIVIKCVTEKCQQNLCPQYASARDSLFDMSALNCCKFCSVYMNTGTLKYDFSDIFQDKMRLLWKSKYKSIKSVNVNAIWKQFETVEQSLDFRNQRFPLPEWCQCKNMYYKMLTVPVDFHPVIEIDQSTIVHQEFRIFHKEGCLLLPHSYVRAVKTVERNRLRILKEKKLANFIFNLIFTRSTPRVELIPELDRSINYFLFPKSLFLHKEHGCWRISSCLQERDILCETSEEHRSAYCLLKILARLLSDRSRGIQFHNYEIKVSVINHIKHCKNPRVGAHVCMLSILHEISRCKSKGIMEHPILHMNLYDMIQYSKWDTQRLIRFKLLILLLANQRGMYTLEDLFNDVFSVNSIYSWYTMLRFPSFAHYHSNYYSNYQSNYQSVLLKITERELFKELKKFIRNRKRNSSKDVMSQLIMDLIWKKHRWDVQNSVMVGNIDYNKCFVI